MKKVISFLALIMAFSLLGVNAYGHEYAMSFFYGGTTNTYTIYADNTQGVLNTASPGYFDIYPDGSLNYKSADRTLVKNMHDRNIKVIPFLSNHWDRALGITALDNTETLTGQIASVVYDYNMDGVNVDIENVTHLHRDAYTNFVKRLKDKMPDKIVSVSVAANPYGWTTGWHGSYDYAGLANYSDYLMIMGYDESYQGGPVGAVASGPWVEKTIQYALKYTTPDKIVLGMPFFGRYWKSGEAVGGIGITAMDVENLLANYKTTKKYHADKQSAQVFLTLTEGEVMPKIWGGRVLTAGDYEIWYDDIQATMYKLSLVEKYNLKGSGSWAMGQEDKKVWAEYLNYKTTPTPAPTPTPTPTPTAAPTATPSPTPTPTPTATPTPTTEPTPTPEPTTRPKPAKPGQNKPKKALPVVNSKGWVTGRKTFEITDKTETLTRADAIRAIMLMVPELPDPSGISADYTDTKNHKYKEFIDKAAFYGIIDVPANKKFNPDSPISKEELIVYLDRTFFLPNTVNFFCKDIKDLNRSAGSEAYFAINKFYELDIIYLDSNEKFNQKANITKEEACDIFYNLIGTGPKDFNPARSKDGRHLSQPIISPR